MTRTEQALWIADNVDRYLAALKRRRKCDENRTTVPSTTREFIGQFEKRLGDYRDICERCDGSGARDAAWSGVDPSCPDCDGKGRVTA